MSQLLSDQLSLDEPEPDEPDISPYWIERASAFHAANPDVYELLVFYAREAFARGAKRIGIELLWNRMRWERVVVLRHRESDFKLNQNYKAWYARRIMRQEPDLAGIFETRRRR